VRFDADSEAILAEGYVWNDPKANSEIQARNPGAPRLVGYTFEQCTLGGTNCQATHDANALKGVPSRYELTSEDRSLGQDQHDANALKGVPSRYEFTSEDRSLGSALGGSKSGGSKGKCGGNQLGCGLGSHSAKKTDKGTTQLNYLAYCASDAGKAYFANRCTHTAPGHYSELLKLDPPLHFMNASG
jgi:hypothetical protein